MRISDWSSDVCSSDLTARPRDAGGAEPWHDARGGRRDARLLLKQILDRTYIIPGTGIAETSNAPYSCLADLDGFHPACRLRDHRTLRELGRASCRERVWQ